MVVVTEAVWWKHNEGGSGGEEMAVVNIGASDTSLVHILC